MRWSCRTVGTHAVSAVPWPHRSLHAPHGTTSHQGLQGFSIHSAKTVSSLPFPSPPFTSLTSSTVPSRQLPHNVLTMLPPLSAAALHSLWSADPLPTAVKPQKPWKRAWKTDRMANQIMQWHSRYSEGLFFCILCNMSGKTQRKHTCGTRLTAQWFLTGGVFKTTVASAHNPLAAVLSICLCLLFAFQTWQLFLAPARSNEGETQTMCGN